MSRVERHIFPSPQAVADAVAQAIIDRAAASAPHAFHLFLAGGSTPRAAYESLASRRDEVDWRRVHIWFGDERAVPPEDADKTTDNTIPVQIPAVCRGRQRGGALASRHLLPEERSLSGE